MTAPDFCFARPAPLHPHIYSNGASPPAPAQRAALAHARPAAARAGHICLDILYDSGAWSPALTMASVARSLRSMLAQCARREPPPGDEAYCRAVGDGSSRRTRWTFHDDKV